MFTSSHQMTPLHWAPGIDHVDTVTCVDKGANTSTKDEVSECEYTADCKLVLLIRVCSQSPPKGIVEYIAFFNGNLHTFRNT